jgi:hypothetical protein
VEPLKAIYSPVQPKPFKLNDDGKSKKKNFERNNAKIH